MAIVSEITVEIAFKRIDPDCSECFCCQDKIYGKQYELVLLIVGTNRVKNTDSYVCAACLDAYKDSEDFEVKIF